MQAFNCLSEKMQLREEVILRDGQVQGLLINLDLLTWSVVVDYPVFLLLVAYA